MEYYIRKSTIKPRGYLTRKQKKKTKVKGVVTIEEEDIGKYCFVMPLTSTEANELINYPRIMKMLNDCLRSPREILNKIDNGGK